MMGAMEVETDDPDAILRNIWVDQNSVIGKAVADLATGMVLAIPVAHDLGETEVRERLVATATTILTTIIVEMADGHKEQLVMLDNVHRLALAMLNGFEKHKEKGDAKQERQAAQGNGGSSPWGL